MAWETTVGVVPGQKINAAKIVGIIEGQSSWKGDVDANGYHLYRSADLPIVSHYDFAPIEPAVGLTAATPVTLALTPFPPGVTAASPGLSHKLRITDGVGGNEVVTITAVNPGVSVTFTPASNHTSGNWSIQSATAGLQEAWNVSLYLQALPGSYAMYGTVTPPTGAILRGAGRGASEFEMVTNGIKAFRLIKTNVSLFDFKLTGPTTPTSGSIGIYTAGTGSGVSGGECDDALISNVHIVAFHQGLVNAGSGGAVNLQWVQVNSCVDDGFKGISAQGRWVGCQSIGNGGHGFHIVRTSEPTGGITPRMLMCETFRSGGWGVYNPSGQLSLLISFINFDKLGGVYVNDIPGQGFSAVIQGCNIEWSGDNDWFGDTTTAPGILIDEDAGTVQLTDNLILGSQGIGVDVKNHSNLISGNVIQGSGLGGVSGNRYGMRLTVGGAHKIWQNKSSDPLRANDSGQNHIYDNEFNSQLTGIPALHVVTGSLMSVDRNQLTHSLGGSELALDIDAGVTIHAGTNKIFSGVMDNDGTLTSGTNVSLF